VTLPVSELLTNSYFSNQPSLKTSQVQPGTDSSLRTRSVDKLFLSDISSGESRHIGTRAISPSLKRMLSSAPSDDRGGPSAELVSTIPHYHRETLPLMVKYQSGCTPAITPGRDCYETKLRRAVKNESRCCTAALPHMVKISVHGEGSRTGQRLPSAVKFHG
jgi:hypothetical protein